MTAEHGDAVLALLLELGVPLHAAKMYTSKLLELGFDTAKAIETLTVADMDALEIKEGHRRLLQAHASLHGKREHPAPAAASTETADVPPPTTSQISVFSKTE